MATLTKDTPRVFALGNVFGYPVIASDIIFEGAAVGENDSGYARPLVAGDPFLGFAEDNVDNSDGSAGDKNIQVKSKCFVKLAITGIAITSNDRPVVYASDDNTFTLTAGSNSPIGRVAQWLSTGYAIVEADALMAAEIVALAAESAARAAGDA